MNIIHSKTIKYIAIAIVATMHYSCIKEVENLNLPNTPPKLVVQSFISPGDSITATIYASKPINYNVTGSMYYSAYDTVKTATVTLTNMANGSSTTIPFDIHKKKYILPPLDFTIEKGTEYELSVTANRFEPITARTTVPTGLATAIINKIDTISVNEYGEYLIRISGSINDPASELNYYKVSTYFKSEYIWEDEHNIYFSDYSSTYFTDNNHNGGIITFRHETNWYYYENENNENNTIVINLIVYEIDEHYDKFHKSLETIHDVMDNPFTESSHLYSNIEGGLGVFASFIKMGQTSTEE